MSWISFAGTTSTSKLINVEHIPALPSWERRVEALEIPGRSGDLVYSNDDYAPATIRIDMAVTSLALRDAIAAWLIGAGDLILSSLPTKLLKARVSAPPVWAPAGPNFRRFTVEFIVQPFWREVTPTVHTVVATGNITNPGTRLSLPIITVTGTGVLTVNGTAMTITETGVVINSEIEECYIGSTNKNATVTGGFPHLDPGANTVTLGAGITQAVIAGLYRWY